MPEIVIGLFAKKKATKASFGFFAEPSKSLIIRAHLQSNLPFRDKTLERSQFQSLIKFVKVYYGSYAVRQKYSEVSFVLFV